MCGKRSALLGLFFILVFPALSFSAAVPLFDSWPNYLSDKKPTGVHSADIDGDGDLDLVVCHFQGDTAGVPTVVVFKNNGAGTFSRDTALHLVGSPVAVVAKDVERDGDVDIVTCNENTNNVTIFKNKGFGRGFEEGLSCFVQFTPKALVVDSLNFDVVNPGEPQLMDIATVNFTSGTASILINHGAAAFPVESIKFVGIQPRSMAAFDMDNDGDLDLAFSVSILRQATPQPALGGNGLVVMPNIAGVYDDSARVFFRIPMVGTPLSDTFYNPQQVIAADFNGDGFADLALADSSDPGEANPRPLVCIFRNLWPTVQRLNDSTFAPPDTFRVGTGCRSIFAADLDGDGDLDIAAANAQSGSVSILKNNGNATFAPKKDYLSPATPYWIDGGDYDRDGDIDLVVTSISGHSLAVLRNGGDGSFEAGREYSTGSGSGPRHVVAADFDADGDVDLAVALQGSRNQMCFFRNNGDGTFAPAVFFGGGNFRSVAVADVDGDGDFDLAAANQGSPTLGVSVFKNRGNAVLNPQFDPQVNYAAGRGYSIVARDFDGVNGIDLAVANADANPPTVTILKNDSSGNFTVAQSYPTGPLPEFVTSADVDGDGDWDLITADRGTTLGVPDSVSILFNDSTGAFPTRVSYWVGSAPVSLAAADFNGDGHVDLAATLEGTPVEPDNAVAVLFNNGDGTFGPAQRYTPGAGAVALFASDIDLDGDPDIVTAANGINSISFLENLGNGTFAPSIEYGAGLFPLSLTAADLDNDGDPDLAVVDADFTGRTSTTNGALTILENQTISDCFMRGDLNGDGLHTATDVVLEVNCIFAGVGACPLCVTDTNCDSVLSGADVVALVGKVFGGGNLCSP